MASAKRTKVEQMAFVSANVPASLKDRLLAVAGANERVLSQELRLAIRAHVEAHEASAEANGAA